MRYRNLRLTLTLTAQGKDNDQQNLLKKLRDIAGYATRSLQMSEDTIILFISS